MNEQPPADPAFTSYVPVCAIGASAGGVGALQTLFRLLPDNLGLAYVVVIHLSPDQPSAMHEIIGACTEMPVYQVTDGPKLLANCVYVIAPDRELVIDGDDVKSRPISDPRSRRAPIDMFFRSIAAGRGDGIAVVLTGAGSDGAVGVRAIKEGGGIVMVQEPAEAGFPSMPRNAIATGVADVVAPLARLAERIAEAAHSKEAVRSLDEDGVANDVRRIIAFLRTRTGHDFSGYKRSTVLRRIQRRMQVCQIAEPANYLEFLRANPEEAKELLSDLLISVTMFFRDPDTFITLEHRVIRPLLESRSAGEAEDELRAWVVGCATGEEAYSLAILLLEQAEHFKMSVPIQIFATDLDEGALATAREGRYPRSIEADVSAERLRRFFVDEGTHYRIDRQVRDLILFATHSVVREPPFMRLDLITCRNVLIYLERALQQHVNTIFRYGLKKDGYLFLGPAETADTSDNYFVVVDRDARIYRASPTRPDFVPTLSPPGPWSASRPALTESRLVTARLSAGEVLGESHAAALEASAPPSALVDAEQGVLHLSPSAGRFILLSAGPLSGRLPSIVRPELRLDLKLALDRAFDARQPTITRPLDVVMEAATRRVCLHVAPLPIDEGAAPRAIVYFLDSGPGRTEADEDSTPSNDELHHLHSELKIAQEAELAGRVRNDSAVQELRANNEELQSLNEEYRSTAEELETSKEELQSINEELQTVNAELKSKLGIISAAHNDLQNLTASSEIGTLFLDRDLRIRMFTPRVADLINFVEADVGRPITNFTHRLDYADIAGDVRRVLRDLTPSEAEVRSSEGRWFTVRIRPYLTTERKVEGAVVTFDDNTDQRLARDALRESEERQAFLLKLSDALRATSDPRKIMSTAAELFARRLDLSVVHYLTFHEDADSFEVVGAYADGRVPVAVGMTSGRVSDHGPGWGDQLRRGEAIFSDDHQDRPEPDAKASAGFGIRSGSAVPLIRNGQLVAILSTAHHEPHDWTDAEKALQHEVAERTWAAVERARTEAALRESEARHRFRVELADALHGLVSPSAVVATVAERLGSYLGVDQASYYEIEGDRFVVAEEWRTTATPGVLGSHRLADFGPSHETRLHAGEVVRLNDTRGVDGSDAFASVNIAAMLSVPLHRDGRWAAGLHVVQARPRVWTGDEEALVREVAAHTWAAVERARAEAALRESEQTLASDLAHAERLRSLSARLVAEESLQAIYDEILSATVAITRADAGTVQMYDPATKSLELIASQNFSRGIIDYFHRVDAGSLTACGIALKTGESAFVDFPDEVADPGCQLLAGEGIQSAVAVPLVSRTGAPLGMLNAHWRQTRHRLNERELRFLDLLARQAADLIEQRLSQIALRESEERLQGALSVSTVGVLFWDTDSRLTQVNDAFLRLTGFSREELIGKTWQELTPPEFHPASEQALEDVRERGEAAPYEKQNYCRDGSRWWGLFAPKRLSESEVVEFVIDVSKRHQAEAAVRESEARLRDFGDASQDILWIRDAETLQWQYLTPSFETIYGVSREEALAGNNYGSWLELIVPEDRVNALESIQRVKAGEKATFEFRIKRPLDGAIRWMRDTDFPILNEAGDVAFIGSIGHDFTELREAELRLQALIDGMPQLVLRADDPGLWTWASPQWTAYTGQEEVDSRGWGWLESLHPDDRDAAREAWNQAVERGELEVEYRIGDRHENYRWFQTRAVPVRDKGGDIIEWLGTSTDIHDLRLLQDRQQVMVRELQHRTRNLITVVRAVSQQTQREVASLDEFRDRFGDRLSALSRVQGLLSHLSAGARVTFDELLKSELAALGAPDGRVSLDGPADVPLRSAMVQTLSLALHELATNALKYGALASTEGHLTVRWKVITASDEMSRLCVDWRETGVDMTYSGDLRRDSGYGRELIEHALPYQLGATTSYEMGPDGVHCVVDVPITSTTA